MSAPTIKVLYIAGMRRSGSAILNNILDQIDGLFSVGEIQLVWHVLKRNWPCACGKVYRECAIWQPILEKANGAAGLPDVEALAAAAERLRHRIPALWSGRLLRFVGVGAGRLPFVGQDEVRIAPTHAVYGNPRVASRSGVIPLRIDNAWRASLSRLSGG
jgi:hypothetical protein